MTPADQKALHEEVLAHMGEAGLGEEQSPVFTAHFRLSQAIQELGIAMELCRGRATLMALFVEVETADLELRKAEAAARA